MLFFSALQLSDKCKAKVQEYIDEVLIKIAGLGSKTLNTLDDYNLDIEHH